MRKSYKTEIVITFLIGVAGGLISKLTLLTFIVGMTIILLTSYFLFSKLKEHTINEYIKATADNSDFKTASPKLKHSWNREHSTQLKLNRISEVDKNGKNNHNIWINCHCNLWFINLVVKSSMVRM